ncbi:single-stranded nucleic acid binding r3h [Stemphylium lycopersici]|nr:single-stranded nucleic acid binding r3h [Stemphylium lycopersici]
MPIQVRASQGMRSSSTGPQLSRERSGLSQVRIFDHKTVPVRQKRPQEPAVLAQRGPLWSALALNVDPEHQNDHIPYSDATLNMYQQNSTWAATQEKQLRLFAADPDEKRLRFKPMPRNQRAFIHHLAEDFGMDSESMDPEPHRHVAIFKTPKFVMAPMRTLADCARTRQIQQRIAPAPAPSAAPAPTLRPKQNANVDPYNAFLILNPRFALTIEEVTPIVKSVLSTTSFRCELEVTFLPGEAVALKPPLAARLSIPEGDMQAMLESIQAPLSQALTAQSIGRIQLARLDSTLTVLRKESDAGPGSGWSQVAASKGIPLRQVQKSTPFGNKGGFAVLSLSSKKKKDEAPVEVAEDWEAAEEEEEQKEKTSGANSGVVSEDEGGVLHGMSEGASNDVPEASSSMAASDENKASSSEEAPLAVKPMPACTGYRDTTTVRISDQSEFVRQRSLAKARCQPTKAKGSAPEVKPKLQVRCLPQDLQALGRDMFFKHYVSDFSRTWDFLYRYIGSADAPAHLTLGIEAVSLAFLSHQVSSQTAKDLARRKYCEAIRSINTLLQDPHIAKARTSFEGVVLLDLFEKIMQSASVVDPYQHAPHVGGALALVKLRGVDTFEEGSEMRALMGLSLNGTICSLYTGRSVDNVIQQIRDHAARFINTDHPKWKLSGLMLEITDLAAEMRQGTLTTEERVAESIRIDRELESLALDAAPSWTFERKSLPDEERRGILPDGFPPVYDIYPDRMITQMWNVLRVTRILLCGEIIESCTLLSGSNATEHSDRAQKAILDMVGEICASVPPMTDCDFAAKPKLPTSGGGAGKQHTHTMSHILDVYVLIFSLYVVAWSRHCPPAARDWSITQLQYIAEHFAIREAAVILDILNTQAESDDEGPKLLIIYLPTLIPTPTSSSLILRTPPHLQKDIPTLPSRYPLTP